MKFYKDREKNEALQRFDSHDQFSQFIMEYAMEMYKRIKEGDVEWLRAAVDDLGILQADMKSDFVIADPKESDMNAIQHMVEAAQRRLYG